MSMHCRDLFFNLLILLIIYFAKSSSFSEKYSINSLQFSSESSQNEKLNNIEIM